MNLLPVSFRIIHFHFNFFSISGELISVLCSFVCDSVDLRSVSKKEERKLYIWEVMAA